MRCALSVNPFPFSNTLTVACTSTTGQRMVAGLIIGRRDDTALVAAHGDGFPPQSGVRRLLHGREERIRIEMKQHSIMPLSG